MNEATKCGIEWQDVLGFRRGEQISLLAAQAAYRAAARKAHPDKHGGSNAAMATVNTAWEQAQRALT